MRRPTTHAQPQSILTTKEWSELHDYLTLALDALGDAPTDVDESFLLNCVMHQRLAIRITHRKMEVLGK